MPLAEAVRQLPEPGPHVDHGLFGEIARTVAIAALAGILREPDRLGADDPAERQIPRAAAHQPEQRRAAHWQSETLRQSRTGGTAERETNVALDVGQSRGASCMRRGDVRYRLREHFARTLVRVAAEPTHEDGDADGASLPRKIRQPAPIPTVDPLRRTTAPRACHRSAAQLRGERNAVKLRFDTADYQIAWNKSKRGLQG
jgi:hypothetical protein